MNRIEEVQSKEPFIHSIEFGLDGVQVVFEYESDITGLVDDRTSRTIICEGNVNFENIYADIMELVQRLVEEASVVKRNPEY